MESRGGWITDGDWRGKGGLSGRSSQLESFWTRVERQLTDRSAVIAQLAGKYRAQWGEGPIWWDGKLYYVDIEGCRVVEFTPRSGEERSWDIGERVGSVVPRAGGGFVVAGDSGFAFFDPGTGQVSTLGNPEPDKRDNRFNDGKCSPDGRYFAGTISLTKTKGAAGLYRMNPDLGIHQVLGGITNSNGLVWTADGETLFYIDTPRLSVLAFRYEESTGSLWDEREAFSTAGRVPGVPDGMAIDAAGNLWIAFCHGSCVVCFDQQGNELERLFLPCREVTAPAFGGENLRDLYVTTGQPREGIEEDAGRLFVFSGLGAAGCATHCFRG